MLLVELVERMVFVFVRITLPSARWGELTKSISLPLKDEEPMHGVEDEEVSLTTDALVVLVIETPAYRPPLAEAAEFVRHLDLGFVAVF
jgi:hypothetical protein